MNEPFAIELPPDKRGEHTEECIARWMLLREKDGLDVPRDVLVAPARFHNLASRLHAQIQFREVRDGIGIEYVRLFTQAGAISVFPDPGISDEMAHFCSPGEREP